MEPPEKRRKKKDKAREKEERNGKFSSRHVRMYETKPKLFHASKLNAERE
jgi:hypothetical protein